MLRKLNNRRYVLNFSKIRIDFANSGAWSDINNIFVLFNQIISFICTCMSDLFKNLYKDDRQYKYKKISNLLKHSASHIIDNTNSLYELLLKRNATFGKM